MKKWLLTVALALGLAGCAANPADTTTLPQDTTLPPETTLAAPAESLYAPDAPLTARTGGALQVYELEGENYTAILPAGTGLLLLNNDGFGDTNMTLVSGPEGFVTAAWDAKTAIASANGCLRAVEDGVVYYDAGENVLVRLNSSLQESSRVTLPEMMGLPLISGDGTQVYYHTGTQIRVLELKTGISRLLRDQGENILELAGLYCDDTVLKVYVDDADPDMATQYLSTANGYTIHYGDDTVSLRTREDMFYAEVGSGFTGELLFGQADGAVKVLEPAGTSLWTVWLPGVGGAVHCSAGDGSWTMDYYDLASGKRTASLTLPDTGSAWSVTEDAQGDLWFLYSDSETRQTLLCRWDISRSAVSDSRVYTGRRYTAADPDVTGLAECRVKAEEIGQTYGVEILLWEDATAAQPQGYTLYPEHKVSAIAQSLAVLESAMARYPQDFFLTAAKSTGSGVIRICLVDGIYGSEDQGTLSSVDGVQYWVDGDPYIALRLSGEVERNFYHEMCHVIETRVLGRTVLYDDWESLNPKGFSYDYDYIANRDRTDTAYLEGEDRAFVDLFSMSYPKEDRAGIMEYAMMEGNEEVFASDWMQRKLLRLCRGIRKAFGLSKYEEVLPWEAYLETSLVP